MDSMPDRTGMSDHPKGVCYEETDLDCGLAGICSPVYMARNRSSTKGTQSFKGLAEYFTGDVTVDMLFPPNETAQFSGGATCRS